MLSYCFDCMALLISSEMLDDFFKIIAVAIACFIAKKLIARRG